MKDPKTHDYFDTFTPHYDPKRFDFAIDYLNRVATDEQSVLDIGCGDGATLHLIKQRTPLRRLCGLDVSENYLQKANRLVGCDTINGSILEEDDLKECWGRFDYCTLGAVIHHLIGKTRKESFRYAQACLHNSVRLLKPGGTLIIFEPTYSPSVAMDLVFWVKKVFAHCTNRRIEISRRWANLGQPVVSYYTKDQLMSFIDGVPGTEVVTNNVVDQTRLGYALSRRGMALVVKKAA